MEKMSTKRAVQFAIQTEELGAKAYKLLASRFEDDKEISEVFSRLAQDELVHEKQFKHLLEKVTEQGATKEDDKGFGMLKAMAMSEFFSSREGLEQDLEAIKTRGDALKRAFELEKATLGYYQALKDVLTENKVLNQIIAAEKEHLLAVMRCLLTDAKYRGLSDKG